MSTNHRENVVVIGSGFAGLSAACFLAKSGMSVDVVERHDTPGGRARKFNKKGFTFDMGPSWYWMPDVFERFFSKFDTTVAEQYDLVKLSPAFSVIFDPTECIDIPAEVTDVLNLFESIEPGSGRKLQRFLSEAQYKYEVGMHDLVYKPGLSWGEFLDARLFKSVFQLGVFSSYASHVRRYFSDSRLIRIMEFPVLFLGGTPSSVPALYSLMTYAGIALGTWYPKGGMYEVVLAMYRMALDLGVRFHFSAGAKQIHVLHGKAQNVVTDRMSLTADYVVATADYAHVEQELLPREYRTYSTEYWNSRVMAPSALICFLGINKKLPRLNHHNLFFDASYELHADAIYGHPQMPEKPLFYVCAPSVTDASVAPAGHENLFVLIPLSTELEDTDAMRESCLQHVLRRLERYLGESIQEHIVYSRTYAQRDFQDDYSALRGNAYGLANTLKQTAVLKPRMKSPKVSNLYFAGQLTVPGPGVPPALISGEIVANLILKSQYKSSKRVGKHAVEVV